MKVFWENITQDGFTAKLEMILWEDSQEFLTGKKRPLLLVCPGGGYRYTSDREADTVAMQFVSMGYHAAVLRYSTGNGCHYPVQLLQLSRAMQRIRSMAEEWFVDREKIVVVGFSAGGHLAASLGTLWQNPQIAETIGAVSEDIRPYGLILGYPVTSSGEFGHQGSFRELLGDQYDEMKDFVSLENRVSEKFPPCFLWHTWEDATVNVETTLLFATALRSAGVPFDLHIYQHGPHGLSLANEQTAKKPNKIVPAVQTWIPQVKIWLKELFEEKNDESCK